MAFDCVAWSAIIEGDWKSGERLAGLRVTYGTGRPHGRHTACRATSPAARCRRAGGCRSPRPDRGRARRRPDRADLRERRPRGRRRRRRWDRRRRSPGAAGRSGQRQDDPQAGQEVRARQPRAQALSARARLARSPREFRSVLLAQRFTADAPGLSILHTRCSPDRLLNPPLLSAQQCPQQSTLYFLPTTISLPPSPRSVPGMLRSES